MSKNPFLNALLAALYIAIIVTFINIGTNALEPTPTARVFIPFAMLSLFVLSAAVMGYLFLSEPIQLFLAGEKKKAVMLFLQTVAVFAGITVVALVLSFTRVV